MQEYSHSQFTQLEKFEILNENFKAVGAVPAILNCLN
jgi:hypothetical protein